MHNRNTNEMMRIPEITIEELQTAINRLKKKRQICRQQWTQSRSATMRRKKMVRQIFNVIVKQNDLTPEAWKKVRIKVVHKKGDVEDVGNYRPICSLPALYKLFTTDTVQQIVSKRRKIRLDSEAHIRQQIILRRTECLIRDATSGESECGFATIDFMKAFDSITYKAIWNALNSCGIEHDYISLLKNLYRDQKATEQTDEESDMFEIKKGTKQGDPLSSLLFSTVLQKALEDDIPR